MAILLFCSLLFIVYFFFRYDLTVNWKNFKEYPTFGLVWSGCENLVVGFVDEPEKNLKTGKETLDSIYTSSSFDWNVEQFLVHKCNLGSFYVLLILIF